MYHSGHLSRKRIGSIRSVHKISQGEYMWGIYKNSHSFFIWNLKSNIYKFLLSMSIVLWNQCVVCSLSVMIVLTASSFEELNKICQFLAATKQLYEWYFLSVRLSVCLSVRLSVRHTFWLHSHHHIIMKFSGVIAKDQGNIHAKGQDQRSKVKVTEVKIQLSRFRTVTPVWIHIWWWNDTYSLMLLRRGARSHSTKNLQIWPRLGVSGL